MSKRRRSMSKTLRALYYRAEGLCAYCRRKTEFPSIIPALDKRTTVLRATVDHRTPLSRGGALRGDNIVLACNKCNNTKGDMLPNEWTQFMLEFPNWWETHGREAAGRKAIMSERKNIRRNGDVTYTEEGWPIVPVCCWAK